MLPKIRLINLFMYGFIMRDKKTITAGMVNNIDAINSFDGVSSPLSPLISPSTFSGTYSSK